MYIELPSSSEDLPYVYGIASVEGLLKGSVKISCRSSCSTGYNLAQSQSSTKALALNINR